MASKSAKSKTAGHDPLISLEAAQVLDDFEAGGQSWHPAYMRCGDSWEIQIQAKTGRPVAITIEGPDTTYAIEIINRFKTDEEFRKSALPGPKAIRKGSYSSWHIKVSYKGKAYRLLWAGKTQYGDKAKLSFLDGSKEFWADLALVTDPQEYTPRRPRYHGSGIFKRVECQECGSWHDEHENCHECGGC